jgi:hypothetical protein
MDKLRFSTTATLLGLFLSTAPAAQLLESGSFESPRVKGRTPRIEGGSPLRATRSDWLQFDDKVNDEGGRLKAGITDEMAHSGRQSLFIDYNKLATDKAAVTLASKLISIQPGKTYRVAIWGRLPKVNPLTIEDRLAYLKLFVEFFQADGETPVETGEQRAMRAQPMPGSKNRPPIFTSGKWSEYFAVLKSREDACFMKVSWFWDTPAQDGAVTGTILFDDAVILGEPGPTQPEPELRDPEKMDDEGNFKTAPADPATTTKPVAPGTPPASTPKPRKP